MSVPTWRRKLEFGDLLITLYIVVFVRQYAWTIGSNKVAWAVTLICSALLWVAYLRTKEAEVERTPRVFWLVVALPLLLIFAMRFAFPDLSFDVLNHRLVQGERALRGVLLPPDDFFPSIFPFNPAPDMLTGISRHLLGYRLGTIINLLALVWAGTILEKILRPLVRGATLRCVGVLLALYTEHALFEINNYMVDLLALPLTLEALRLALAYNESAHKERDLLYSALLLGAGMGLKLTNAAVALPVLAVFAVQLFSQKLDARTMKFVALSAALFVLPLLPHAVYIYRETGSPVFPLYNNFIKSPLWRHITPYDGRWGPHSWTEILLWPLLSRANPGRLSELGVYSGRLVIGFVGAVVCMVLPNAATRARMIALAVILGSLMWSLTSGYVRYALFVEVLGGVLIVYLSQYICLRAGGWVRPVKLAAAAVPLLLLGAQCALATHYVMRTEWSQRPTVFNDNEGFLRELRWVMRDRELMPFQTAANRERFGRVEAWIVSGVKSNGVEVLLRNDVPMLAVNNLEYFEQPQSRARFASTLEGVRGKRVFSLTLTEELNASLEFIKRRGLAVGEITTALVPFFSAERRIHMTLIEIRLPEKHERPERTAETPEVTEATGPLNDDAYSADLSVKDAMVTLRPGQKATILVGVKNLSDYIWPARGQSDGKYSITVADSWLDARDERMVENLDGRSTLPRDLWPGESVDVPLTIKAPAEVGEYFLEIDLVQEGVTFFKGKGSHPARYRIKVQ